MPKYHGRLTVIYLSDGATLRDISNDVNSVETPQNADTAEVSGFGDSTKKYVVGLQDSNMRLQGNFNDGANLSHVILSAQVGGTTGLACWVMPRGGTTGAPVFRGSVLVSEYSVSSGIGGAVTWQAGLVPFDTNPPDWTTL